jgi:hypothetical protein
MNIAEAIASTNAGMRNEDATKLFNMAAIVRQIRTRVNEFLTPSEGVSFHTALLRLKCSPHADLNRYRKMERGIMSKINGDKARDNKRHRKQAKMRVQIRELRANQKEVKPKAEAKKA